MKNTSILKALFTLLLINCTISGCPSNVSNGSRPSLNGRYATIVMVAGGGTSPALYIPSNE